MLACFTRRPVLILASAERHFSGVIRKKKSGRRGRERKFFCHTSARHETTVSRTAKSAANAAGLPLRFRCWIRAKGFALSLLFLLTATSSLRSYLFATYAQTRRVAHPKWPKCVSNVSSVRTSVSGIHATIIGLFRESLVCHLTCMYVACRTRERERIIDLPNLNFVEATSKNLSYVLYANKKIHLHGTFRCCIFPPARFTCSKIQETGLDSRRVNSDVYTREHV